MKLPQVFILLFSVLLHSQTIEVDSDTYTPQQLIEDIFIKNSCISNVTVTNVIGGDFGTEDKSYGYFDATNTTFPIKRGIVLTTGRLKNTEGPNITLSDDDAPGWEGDKDLEITLNEANTLNATVIEFEFSSISSQISFNYIFASEEYQENNRNTCRYSDLFGFLIKPINGNQYENIALVPNTTIPVKVTTVHSGIPNECPPINAEYFEKWNNQDAPINFNGQTKKLTAVANIIPNQLYKVKLVIADEKNYRYDSAVFLEAESFDFTIDIGKDKLIETGNPLCEDDTHTLKAFLPGNNTYRWYKDGTLIKEETSITESTYEVTEAGTYSVEIELSTDCIARDTIVIEWQNSPVVLNTTLVECDLDMDGIAFFDLNDAIPNITTHENDVVLNFFKTKEDAKNNSNPIHSPSNYENTIINEVVYALVDNQSPCSSIAEVTLSTTSNAIVVTPLETCDTNDNDGITDFDLNVIKNEIIANTSEDVIIEFYQTIDDLQNGINQLPNIYTNTTPYSETIYIKVIQNASCLGVTSTLLTVKESPFLKENETLTYCDDQEALTLNAGVLSSKTNHFTYKWYKNDTLLESENATSLEISEIGNYTVEVTQNGCSNSRTISIKNYQRPKIESITITKSNNNNHTITIITKNTTNYLYALNNGRFQSSNSFKNVPAGKHMVYVKDENGCSEIEKEINIFGFPSFFTPNADGFNDTWQPVGVTQPTSVTIFNRFGKVLYQFNVNSKFNAWDGTYKNAPLPSNDYWYIAEFPSGKKLSGHFSLKR